MKVAENREEPIKKEQKAFYVKDDNRARLDKWRNDMRAKGFVRSESNPRYFRTASRSNYVRDRSNFGRQNLNARSNSRQIFNQGQNENRSGSANKPGTSNARSGSKTLKRLKEIYVKT